MSGANDCPVPVAHHDIVSILETIRAGAVADTLLALLELLEETEVTRDWKWGVNGGTRKESEWQNGPFAIVERRMRVYSGAVAEGESFRRVASSPIEMAGRQRPGRHRIGPQKPSTNKPQLSDSDSPLSLFLRSPPCPSPLHPSSLSSHLSIRARPTPPPFPRPCSGAARPIHTMKSSVSHVSDSAEVPKASYHTVIQ